MKTGQRLLEKLCCELVPSETWVSHVNLSGFQVDFLTELHIIYLSFGQLKWVPDTQVHPLSTPLCTNSCYHQNTSSLIAVQDS